jgi:hypothetical protein
LGRGGYPRGLGPALTEGLCPSIIPPSGSIRLPAMRIKKILLFTLGVLGVIAAFLSIKKLRK